MLKAVIFDLDGTLTDSDRVHFQIFQALFAKRGITLTPELYKQKISGRQNAAVMAEFWPELDDQAAQAFSDQKEALFRDRAGGLLQPVAGLASFLAQLEQLGLAAAVVTNAPVENATFMLDALGLSNRFSPVVIGDELPRAKPDPLPYQTALRKLGITANEAIAFEDSVTGIQAAVGAGIVTLGITTTHSASTLVKAGAIRAVADFQAPYIQSLLPLPSPA